MRPGPDRHPRGRAARDLGDEPRRACEPHAGPVAHDRDLLDDPLDHVASGTLGAGGVQRHVGGPQGGEHVVDGTDGDAFRPGDGHDPVRGLQLAGAGLERGEPAGEQVHPDEIRGVPRSRCLAYLMRRAGLADPAVLEDDEAIRERHRLDGVMGDEQAGPVEIAQGPAEERAQVGAGRDVHGRERFVEDQDPGRPGEGARERDPLAFTAGERPRLRAGVDPRREPIEQLESVGARGARTRAARPHREGHVLEHAEMGEQHAVLEGDPDRPPFRRQIVDRLVVEQDASVCGRDQPGDRLDDRRLAGAVRTEDREGLAVAGGERRRRPSCRRDAPRSPPPGPCPALSGAP